MRIMRSRILRRLVLVLAIALPAIGMAVWHWVIPAVIVAAIRERHEGYVAISGWWINGSSAGVTGLVLHEKPPPSSPTWATADRVSTDLSIWGLLRGRMSPKRIVFERAKIHYRIDTDGAILTQLPLKQSQGATPEIVVRDSELTMAQQGRPEMVVRHMNGKLSPGPEGPPFIVDADDDEWGHPHIDGHFSPDFSAYTFQLTAQNLLTNLEKARRVPFVEEKIWGFVQPAGPIGVVLDYRYTPPPRGDKTATGNSDVITTVNFEGTTVVLPTLQLRGEDARGRLSVHDKNVQLENVTGRMAGGRVTFTGPMDFKHKPDRYDLSLDLDDVNLTELPESWQLHRLGVRGRFTGTGGLRLVLTRQGMDMTGTTGDGVIYGAEIQGIPLKTLGIKLRGQGLRNPAEALGLTAQKDRETALGLVAGAAGTEIASQASSTKTGAAALASNPSAKEEGPFLPQWVLGEFRVEGVELEHALARAESRKPGEPPRVVPVSGRLDVQANIRFPLGSLNDWKAYQAHGVADMAGVSIGELDLGRLRGRLEMNDGFLEIADLRGRIIDQPEQGARAPQTEPPPASGPLPPGGFRGRIRSAVVGNQWTEIDIDALELPLDEMATAIPSLARPLKPPEAPPKALPLSGRLTLKGSGQARGGNLSDPRAWTASARGKMPEVAYESTVFKDVSFNLAVDDGRMTFDDVKGKLGDADLRGRGNVGLAQPYPFESRLQTTDLPCHELADLLSSGSSSTRLEGTIAARGEANGTVQPRRVASSGEAEIEDLKVDNMPIGDLPVHWKTQGDVIQITAVEHQRYGGKVSAEARVPSRGNGPIEGTVKLTKVDTAELAAEVKTQESWTLTGHADGQGWFRYTPTSAKSEPAQPGRNLPLEAETHLSAPDLRINDIPVKSAKLALRIHEGNPRFELSADGLGGSFRVAGDGRLKTDSRLDQVQARVEALGLNLYELWNAIGTTGALADLRGQATARGDVQLRGGLDLAHTEGEGTVELRQLIWGFDEQLSDNLRARVSRFADGWRVGPLGGELFGGELAGDGLWMYPGDRGRPMYGVDARIERVMLSRLLSMVPDATRRLAGTGNLRVAGRQDGALGGSGEFRVDRGYVNGLELSNFHVPGVWTFSTQAPRRGTLEIRKAEGRLAGGRVGGEAHFILGDRRDFRARLWVDDVDLRVISREEMGTRPVPGRLSGFINLDGTDPAQPYTYRGEMSFDLDQASLVDIPLLDELDRQLGSREGGVFDDGDIHATINDRKIHIDRMTLVGPLMQVHAMGTMDFEGRLNLEVIVNNQKGVPGGGQAVLARSPNVADEVARRAAQIDQVRDFVSSRLMKFRITGTIQDPIVNTDRSINPRAAIGFFLKTMRLSSQNH